MKKITKALLLMSLGVILVGCGATKEADQATDTSNSKTTETSEKAEEKVTIILNDEDTEIASKEITFEKGDFLQDVMEKNFDVLEEDGMIASLEGHEKDDKEQKYWLYEVNDKQPEVGAKEYELQPGDKIVWNLQKLDME